MFGYKIRVAISSFEIKKGSVTSGCRYISDGDNFSCYRNYLGNNISHGKRA